MAWTWEEMIEAFRALGGTADNIVQGSGTRGRGIFPIDNTKPIRLRVPENLLIPEIDVEFVEGRLKVRDSARCGKSEREFFEEYQNIFSWGGEGRSDCAAFFHLVDALPPEVLSILFAEDRLERQPDSDHGRVERRFLQSRRIERNSEAVLMPVMELVNHGPTAPSYNTIDGISIEGVFSEEVLVRYSLEDPFGMLLAYGFASPERVAFSLPTKQEGARKLIIGRKINHKSKRGAFYVPDFRIDGDTIELSCMMIGNMNFPRLSKGIFCNVAREAGWPNPEEEFDMILHNNRTSFLNLLEILERHEGGMVPTIRKMVRYQLAAMSHCIGTREL